MNALFADAGYWIGLFDPHDRLHERAKAVSRTIAGRQIVTSQIVLMEFLNHYAALGAQWRKRAVEVVRRLQQDSSVVLVSQTPALFESALMLYSQREDKEWGLADCASFHIMQERNITQALAHDIHFQQAGFIALLRED